MLITTDNFADLLTPIHRQIFFEEMLDMEKQYPSVCDLDDMRKKEETYGRVGGLGTWDANTEGNAINEDKFVEGDLATLTAQRFDKGYEITWEMIEDDLYAVFNGMGKGGDAKSLAKGLHQTIEKQIADQYVDGFSAVGYDGVAQFSASHPLANANFTNSNLVTGELTPENLKEALTTLRDTREESGLKAMCRGKQLIVGQNLEWTANEILNSAKQAGEFSNTANVLPEMDVTVLDYIDDDSTYPNAWFVRDPRMKNLVQGWRNKPIYDSERLQKALNYFFFGAARWDNGFVNYRGVVGSTGA